MQLSWTVQGVYELLDGVNSLILDQSKPLDRRFGLPGTLLPSFPLSPSQHGEVDIVAPRSTLLKRGMFRLLN